MNNPTINNNKLFLLILLSIIVTSCRLAKDERQVAGKWDSLGSHYRQFITLSRDHTYYYKDAFDFGTTESFGTWYREGDTVYLAQIEFIPGYEGEVMDSAASFMIFFDINNRHLTGQVVGKSTYNWRRP